MNETKTYDLIFSIGQACSGSDNLRLHKLQDFSYPLDWLAGSTLQGRVEIVASKFKNFLSKEDLVFEAANPSVSCDAYKNTFNDLTFNHDFPMNVPLDESFDEVKAKFDRRIKRLLNKIEQSKNVLFVYVALPTQKNQPEINEILVKAQSDLQKAFPHVECEILYLRHEKQLPVNNFLFEEVSDRVLIVHLFNQDTKNNLPDWAVDFDNAASVFKQYTLNRQVDPTLNVN